MLMLRHWRSLALLFPLSTVSSPSDEKTQPPPSLAGSAETPPERAVPALFTWADVDGDGRLELAAVSEGGLRLLTGAGDGRFEDATARFGLGGVEDAALALWVDYDGDGKLDLFVGARAGASRLFHNEGGVFVDMTTASGLVSEGAVQSAQWFDRDGDGRIDLFLVTAEESELFRGLEGGFFERAELSALCGVPATALGSSPVALPGVGVPQPSGDGKSGDDASGPSKHSAPARTSGGVLPIGPTPSIGGVTPIASFPIACATSIRDQANPGSCVQSSTTPTLGLLYPLSSNLFVAVSGDVGIGTTSPAAKLEVAGTARITDTLTLAPSGDQALDVSTGSIYKGGALFIHTKGGTDNTAVGVLALSGTTGYSDTACGYRALSVNTTGSSNTAVGAYALTNNASGNSNTGIGAGALAINTTGSDNTAVGNRALWSNSTGAGNTAAGSYALTVNTTGFDNTASGYQALRNNTIGTRNVASGAFALRDNSSGYGNTAIGMVALTQNTTGVRNTAVGDSALFYNTTGYRNTAVGLAALSRNTTGDRSSAMGNRALLMNTTGAHNTAQGSSALESNTTGTDNTACGYKALFGNTTGLRNVALGQLAGSNLTVGNDNIDIGNTGVAAENAAIRIGTAGTQTRAFIAGIRGVTTANANAIPVLIDSAGQLGTVSSSRRFKEDIQDMGDATDKLLALRPVTFRYKPEVQAGERPLEYGLIAEEVAEVFPDLVVYDDEGQPFTVKYHLLSAMLLNELQKLSGRFETQAAELERLRGVEQRLSAVEAATRASAPTSLR